MALLPPLLYPMPCTLPQVAGMHGSVRRRGSRCERFLLILTKKQDALPLWTACSNTFSPNGRDKAMNMPPKSAPSRAHPSRACPSPLPLSAH